MAQGASESSTTYVGCCDASAAVAVNDDLFIVADDEDNILRVYRRGGGKPVMQVDLAAHLGQKKKSDEADLEAAALVDDLVFWLGSHGRNSKGQNSPMRQKLIATRVDTRGEGLKIEPVGEPYVHLLDDLLADERLAGFGLVEAAKLAPKSQGALNIEGLTAAPEGHLLIGFRNPIPGGKAIIVPLLNPRKLFEGERARFGPPTLLDLGGLGIRSLGYHDGRYLIIAGHFDNGGESRLYEWKGAGEVPTVVKAVTLKAYNPEGLSFARKDGSEEFLILSDDGTLSIEGKDCKKLKDPDQKRFRGLVIKLDRAS